MKPVAHDDLDLGDALGVISEISRFGAEADSDLMEEIVVFGSTCAVYAGVIFFEGFEVLRVGHGFDSPLFYSWGQAQ